MTWTNDGNIAAIGLGGKNSVVFIQKMKNEEKTAYRIDRPHGKSTSTSIWLPSDNAVEVAERILKIEKGIVVSEILQTIDGQKETIKQLEENLIQEKNRIEQIRKMVE